MGIKLGMLLVFFAVMVGIGLYCRKHATDVSGFVLGGRSVGPWLTAFAYGTSYFSAVVFVGYAGQFGWKYGIAATWAGIGNAILGSLLAWVVLGRRTRIMTQHLDSATMPEFFGKRFGSRSLKVAASVIIFIFLIPYTASLYNGLSRLFGMAFDIDYSVCVVVMAVLTGVYVIAEQEQFVSRQPLFREGAGRTPKYAGTASTMRRLSTNGLKTITFKYYATKIQTEGQLYLPRVLYPRAAFKLVPDNH